MNKHVRAWRVCLATGIVAMGVAVGLLAPHLTDSAELVRMRNALLMQSGPSHFDWTPKTRPRDFLVDSGASGADFATHLQGLPLSEQTDDWSRALLIARHLLEHRTAGVGQPIQSSLERTYRVIRDSGAGYCGDYADVFAALALTAGLEVRSWAFSFDGFGGRGHVFNEVWDERSGSWRMIDVFHNYYFTDDDGTVLSALRFRELMQQDVKLPQIQLIEPDAKLVFKFEDRARDFYRRGLAEWYLWWGTTPFSYDQALLVRAFGAIHRSVEQIGGILQGVHPGFRVLEEAGNADQRSEVERLRQRMFLALALWVSGKLLVFVAVVLWWRNRRRA